MLDISHNTSCEGLTDAQVKVQRQRYGKNVLTPPVRESLWKKFLDCFKDPLIRILLVALVLSTGISFYEVSEEGYRVFFEPLGIFIAILLSTMVGFVFEIKNEKTFKSLNQVNDETLVKTFRNGNVVEVMRKELVVGDVILIDTGEEVPADARLISSCHLLVNESSLTGETQCRKTCCEAEFDAEATYPSNEILKGTMVLEGMCKALVIRVGDATECGKVFESAQVQEGKSTPLGDKLEQLALYITKASYILGIVIVLGRLLIFALAAPQVNVEALCLYLSVGIVLGGGVSLVLQYYKPHIDKNLLKNQRVKLLHRRTQLELWQLMCMMLLPALGLAAYFQFALVGDRHWQLLIQYVLETIMIAVTLIVVAVPEGLPMSVNLSLAISMRKLMKEQTLPRTMHACETMGAASVICTDKTGTLTQNKMHVCKAEFENSCSSLLDEALSLNTTAELDFTSQTEPLPVGNPTEGALLLYLYQQGKDYRQPREQARIIDRIPFSTERKYMATWVTSAVDGRQRLYVKGAFEMLEPLCHLSSTQKTHYTALLNDYQQQAMRTLSFAYAEAQDACPLIENGRIAPHVRLSFMGIVGIADSIRQNVPEAIHDCLQAGIKVKIVTGDTMLTAREIGRQVGIWTAQDKPQQCLTGTEFAALSDEALLTQIDDLKILSRARPSDKERLVRLLQQKHYVVAVTGDGTNDAPALNVADVGLSMGDGTAVAKEASDMTILDNSFSTITNAVMWGRSLYRNIQRFIAFQMTINVVACLIVLAGAFMDTRSPLTVTQMLWVNLIMDTFAALALSSLPPTKKVMNEPPRDVKSSILSKAMLQQIIGVGIVVFIILFSLLLYFRYNKVTSFWNGQWTRDAHGILEMKELTLFFTTFVLLQFWNMFNAKAFMTGRSAFSDLRRSKLFLSIALIIFIGQIAIVELGGAMFNVTTLSWKDWTIITLSTSFILWIGEFLRWCTRQKQH